MHGMSLEGSYLSEATHAQLELFYSLPPDVQAKVYLDEFSIEEVRDSRNYRCNSPYRSCVLRFFLYGFFNYDGSIEEYAHYRQHGMCSKCKEKNDRRLVRRKERLEGIARFNQAVKNDDEEGIDEHMRWCAVESDYDELSEYAPNEHEVLEMVNALNERVEREFYEDLSEGDARDDIVEMDYLDSQMYDD